MVTSGAAPPTSTVTQERVPDNCDERQSGSLLSFFPLHTNDSTGSYHDPPHILWIEEFLSRYHPFGCHDKTIDIFLISSQGSAKLISLRWERFETRKVDVTLIFGCARFVSPFFIVRHALLDRSLA